MKKYNKYALLLLCVLLLSVSLPSCSEPEPLPEVAKDSALGTALTFKGMQDRVLISHNHFNEIKASIPIERFGASIWVPSTTNDPSYAPILAEKYTYKGVEYTVKNGKIGRLLDKRCGETIYSLYGHDESENSLWVFFTDKDKAPLDYSIGDRSYGKQNNDYSEDDAVAAAKSFLDNFINQNSIDRIDVSKYTVARVSVPEKGDANVILKRYVYNVMVHSIDVKLSSDCKVTSYTMSSPILDETVLEQIPNLTNEQYAKLIEPILDTIYSASHDEFSITNLHVRTVNTENKDTYELVYLHNKGCYAVQFVPKFTITLPDGTSENPEFLCCYPLED